MPRAEFLIVLLVAVAFLARLAGRLNVPYPVLLVLGGLLLAAIPGLPHVELEPDLVFVIFLPPLLMHAAFMTSPRELRREWRAIGLLSVGLVLLTMVAVAVVAHEVTSLSWPEAFILGAVVGPTDPVAATTLFRRLGLPDRLTTVLEGESLTNDGTALVALRVAIGATTAAGFSLLDATWQFFGAAIGGILVGLVAGVIVTRVRRHIDDPPVEITLSLFTAYFAYLPAEEIGASGVLAAVTVGVFLAWQSPTGLFQPTSRLQAMAFWDVLIFLLNSLLFILVGLQLPIVLDELGNRSVGSIAAASIAVAATVIATRLAWMLLVPRLAYLVGSAERTPFAERLLLGWSGMRGAVSMAAALSIPLAVDGRPRIIFLTFVTILATLVGQGLTLPALTRRLVPPQPVDDHAEVQAREAAARAALEELDRAAGENGTPEEAVDYVRRRYELRLRHLGADEDQHTLPAVRELQRRLVECDAARSSTCTPRSASTRRPSGASSASSTSRRSAGGNWKNRVSLRDVARLPITLGHPRSPRKVPLDETFRAGGARRHRAGRCRQRRHRPRPGRELGRHGRRAARAAPQRRPEEVRPRRLRPGVAALPAVRAGRHARQALRRQAGRPPQDAGVPGGARRRRKGRAVGHVRARAHDRGLGAPAAGRPAARVASASGTRQGWKADVPVALAGSVTAIEVIDREAAPGAHSAQNPATEGLPPGLGSGRNRTGTPAGCAAGQNASDGPVNGFTPNQYLEAYGHSTLHKRGLTGKGVRVALIEIDGYNPNDITTFAQCFGIKLPTITARAVGQKNLLPPADETTLDLEVLSAAAPGVDAIDVYEGGGSADQLLATVAETLSSQKRWPDVISISLDECEPNYFAQTAQVQVIDELFALAAGAGTSTLVATGDQGATACKSGNGELLLLLASTFPSTSPYVTAVGGTNIELDAQNRITAQIAWNNAPGAVGAGSGGPSLLFERPWWQRGKGLKPGLNNDVTRLTPDIAALADLVPGYAIYCTGDGCESEQHPAGGWVAVGGTSAATPLTAGAIALANQAAAQRGQRPLGLLNPLIYRLADSKRADQVIWDVTQRQQRHRHRHPRGRRRRRADRLLPGRQGLGSGHRVGLAEGRRVLRRRARRGAPHAAPQVGLDPSSPSRPARRRRGGR